MNSGLEQEIYTLLEEVSICDGFQCRWITSNVESWDLQEQYISCDLEALVKCCFQTNRRRTLEVFGFTIFQYECRRKIDVIDLPGYDDASTKEFLDATGIEVIQANMGLGKTERCKEYCNLDINKKKSILILTTKQSLASSFKTQFNNFKHYKDINGSITEDRAVVQLESIHRIKRTYNILI